MLCTGKCVFVEEITSDLSSAALNTFFIFSEEMPKDVEFEVVGDAPEKAPPTSAPEQDTSITNGNKDTAQPSTSTKGNNKSSNPTCNAFNFIYIMRDLLCLWNTLIVEGSVFQRDPSFKLV